MTRRKEPDDTWKYGMLVVRTLVPEVFADLGHAVVDKEVIPPFDGSPEDISTTLIFATDEEAEAAENDLDRLAARARSALADAGFPAEALPTLTFWTASLPAIERGGGRFFYFR